MGGYCALALARLAPERVRALMLVGARPDADTAGTSCRQGGHDRADPPRGAEGLWSMMLPKLFADRVWRRAVGVPRRGRTGHCAGGSPRPGRLDRFVRRFPGRLKFVVGELDPYVQRES